MKNFFDIGNFVNTLTAQAVTAALTERVKLRRKEAKLTQKALAEKSGVSLASLRRFESTGEISLTSLVKIADKLNCLSDFNELFSHRIISDLKDYKV